MSDAQCAPEIILWWDGVIYVCGGATFCQLASSTDASAGFLYFRNNFWQRLRRGGNSQSPTNQQKSATVSNYCFILYQKENKVSFSCWFYLNDFWTTLLESEKNSNELCILVEIICNQAWVPSSWTWQPDTTDVATHKALKMILYSVHSTSSHPPSSPALLSDAAAVVFCALRVWKIVTALLRVLLRQLLRHIWDVLLHEK